MSLNRREMLRLSAVGAGGVMLSSAASSVGLPAVVLQPPRALAPPPVPAAPRAPWGIDQKLFERARAALDVHRIRARDWIGIADFSQPSRDPRFHVVNLLNGTAESFRGAHGSGSDPAHSGYLDHFSNQPGSEATSNGTYTTGD